MAASRMMMIKGRMASAGPSRRNLLQVVLRAPAAPAPAPASVMVASSRRFNGMSIGVASDTVVDGETRVSIVPDGVETLIKKGATVKVVSGAGALSSFSDDMYRDAGAEIVASNQDLMASSDLTVKIHYPTDDENKALGSKNLLSIIQPRIHPERKDALAAQGATAFALDMLLRTLSRGQSFDVLSSQANIAGYRATIEAAGRLQRPFAGGSTAAGRIAPARVMVIGAGVAGLAAIQQAKNMNAIVKGFDVRAAAAEQVEAMGASFLNVDFDEDGSGAGGYAKEMSAEWFAAAEKMLLEEAKTSDVIITTALIPGRKAPVLIKKEMVENMPAGGVTVDLAAEAGGNVETTKPGEVIKHGEITCVGTYNMPGLMGNTSSTLFSGNCTKFLVSMLDKESGEWRVDLEKDEAVRSMCIVHKGSPLDEYVPPPPKVVETVESTKIEEVEEDPSSYHAKGTLMTTGGTAAGIMAASSVPDPSLVSTFALSVWLGSGAVRGVAHALHSPLMSITNAISGMTIIGGMLQLGGGLFPETTPQILATSAVALSAVNLCGGFIITKKMLDMFKRPDDPPEYWHYYLLPSLATVGMLGASQAGILGTGAGFNSAVALASGLGCVGGIAAMSDQGTTRLANYIALGGVGMGVAATASIMNVPSEVFMQLGGASAVGGLAGTAIASKVGPTELPQTVAAFHSLVGIAAMCTAIGDFMIHDITQLDAFHSSSIYMGAWMGSITCTGSIIAWGKLADKLDNKPLSLPGKDVANVGMMLGSVAGGVTFATTDDAETAAAALAAGTSLSGILGFHMTASIGGADMPVVVTLLNSYSGWALCAEGFILNQPVLTIVGALIGSSGAFLTKIMCDGMNRSLANVILGGFGAQQGAVQTAEGLEHTEINGEAAAKCLIDAKKVRIVPGYGLAVAQAQGIVGNMSKILNDNGIDTKFAVHPVAGRMPGQLNVLLAEAGVPYDQVQEMEDVNDEIEETDICFVVGANDTVNSNAEDDPNCDIAGMPVIQAWKADQVIFLKRSMASGYAGVDNPVFYNHNTDMLLGNADVTCAEVVRTLEEHFRK